ncbi:TonB protein, C-terminal domain protein [Bacteriovorax sp. BAL6_X]|uniref:energy transducer TonB n=1 Tax=Bacteriovorax sp. BAL6_X TaxID=1201290 RepID=UPI000385761C|nr:energy transducer TonB [Bacteriovorax sp. BAL6_X]EPZ51422.1 TonB protein, C-terminal domain protein [Bacteriovorax sp. BAL6_X]
MKHRLWFFFFALSLVTHAVIFFSNIRKGEQQMRRERIGIDIQIKAHAISKKDEEEIKEKKLEQKSRKSVQAKKKSVKSEQQQVVTNNTFDNQIVHFEAPIYPRSARRSAIGGSVTISLVVGVDGKVIDAKILKSADYTAFNEAVLSVARLWKFRPQKIESTYTKKIVFTIE